MSPDEATSGHREIAWMAWSSLVSAALYSRWADCIGESTSESAGRFSTGGESGRSVMWRESGERSAGFAAESRQRSRGIECLIVLEETE